MSNFKRMISNSPFLRTKKQYKGLKKLNKGTTPKTSILSQNLICDEFKVGDDGLIEMSISVKTISEANTCEHWRTKYARTKKQKNKVKLFLKIHQPQIPLPCSIEITRVSPRKLDYDNLCSSQKSISDVLCDYIIPGLAPGRADGDCRIKIIYSQEKGEPKTYGVKIKIKPS